jgi:hypothetical protein
MMPARCWSGAHSASARWPSVGPDQPRSKNFAKQSDAQSKMPLQVAAEGGNVDLIRLLLTAGGATNPYELNSSLIAAAQNGRADAVNLLLERGADIWTTRDALTAEQHARKRGFTQIAATLAAASKSRAKRDTSALWALGYLPKATDVWDEQADAAAAKFRGTFQNLSGSLEEALDAALATTHRICNATSSTLDVATADTDIHSTPHVNAWYKVEAGRCTWLSVGRGTAPEPLRVYVEGAKSEWGGNDQICVGSGRVNDGPIIRGPRCPPGTRSRGFGIMAFHGNSPSPWVLK